MTVGGVFVTVRGYLFSQFIANTMSQVVLHLGQQYIEEDLEYYFSGERDKNNQVRPNESIYSLTPFESHIDFDLNDGKVGNFFYPMAPNQLDRIYIGISISLFANHWGGSFLLELLKILRPGGAIILPVYPEGQAAEKGYWSRSFLENIFLSRAKWRGTSNIAAENDGVMSLRVGRKWPERLPSTIEWFYQQRCALVMRALLAQKGNIDAHAFIQTAFVELCHLVWREYSRSAVAERVIIDYLGESKEVSVDHIGSDYGLLVNDLMLSSYVKVGKGRTRHIGQADRALIESVSRYFAPLTDTKHLLQQSDDYADLSNHAGEVMILSDAMTTMDTTDYRALLEKVWARLPAGGVLMVLEDLSTQADRVATLDALLAEFGECRYYSLIAGCPIKPDYAISQYSLAVEENLRQEQQNKQNVVRVVQKP